MASKRTAEQNARYYQNRIAKRVQGFTTSEARGHPRKTRGERSVRSVTAQAKREGRSVAEVAKRTAAGLKTGATGKRSAEFTVEAGRGFDTSSARDARRFIEVAAAQDLTITSIIGTRRNGQGVPLKGEVLARDLLDWLDQYDDIFDYVDDNADDDYGIAGGAGGPIGRVHFFAV